MIAKLATVITAIFFLAGVPRVLAQGHADFSRMTPVTRTEVISFPFHKFKSRVLSKEDIFLRKFAQTFGRAAFGADIDGRYEEQFDKKLGEIPLLEFVVSANIEMTREYPSIEGWLDGAPASSDDTTYFATVTLEQTRAKDEMNVLRIYESLENPSLIAASFRLSQDEVKNLYSYLVEGDPLGRDSSVQEIKSVVLADGILRFGLVFEKPYALFEFADETYMLKTGGVEDDASSGGCTPELSKAAGQKWSLSRDDQDWGMERPLLVLAAFPPTSGIREASSALPPRRAVLRLTRPPLRSSRQDRASQLSLNTLVSP